MNKKIKKNIRFQNLPWRVPAVALLLLVIIFSAILLKDILWAINVPIPIFGQLENSLVKKSTKIYDRTGRVLLYDTAGTMRHISTPLENISPYIIKATIAIEDDKFYEHIGVRPLSVARAFLMNLGNVSVNQGGSTITQQLIKNTLLTKDKSIMRKIKESILAVRIEKNYSKNEIIETYLNEIAYGGTIYGVEEASREYFGKSAKELNLPEAAYLSAIPKAPSFFSPHGLHQDSLKARQKLILKKMSEHGYITADEYEKALQTDVIFKEPSNENIKAPHFSFYVLELLEKKYGKETVSNGNLRIVTTLDWDLQQENELIVRTEAIKNVKKFQAKNASLVAINPQNGQVLSMVGSRNYFDDSVDGQVNVALAKRQPGSTFKPFAYAMAFAKGYTPETILYDLKTQFSTACAAENLSNEYPCYSPDNYDEKFSGPISLREALAQSVNVIGVKTLYLAGINNVINFAKSLGITTLTDSNRYGLSLVLGGGEVTLIEMTAAYGAFANDGVMHAVNPILSIQTNDGKILETFTENPERVLAKEIARTVSDVLSDNNARAPAFGYASPLYFNEATVAVKTGTTNDYRDAWVIGYTPTIVVGTWAGNNDNSPMVKKTSAFILAPMWHMAMEKAVDRFPSAPFTALEKNIVTPASITKLLPETARLIGLEDAPNNDSQLALWAYPVNMWLNMQGPLFAAQTSID